MELKARLHNRFDIEVRDSQTGKVKERRYAENLILNQAWAEILKLNTDWAGYMKIGIGTGTLAASRTTLFTQIDNRAFTPANAVYEYDEADGHWSCLQSAQWLETEHVGQTITEVGLGTNTVLCTHAMIKDMNGNLTPIVKTNLDILTVYATTYVLIDLPWSANAELDLRRDDYNPLICQLLGMRPNDIGCFPTHFYFWRGDCIGTGIWDTAVFSANSATYNFLMEIAATVTLTPASKTAVFYARLPAANANVGGVKGWSLTRYYRNTTMGYNYHVPAVFGRFPATTHTQTSITEQIGTGDGSETHFKTTFPFVKSGAVIKVDGTLVSATVHQGLPDQKDIRCYMRNHGVDGSGVHGPNNAFPNLSSSAAVNRNYSRLVIENPFYATHGIDSIDCTTTIIEVSTDMTNWTQVYSGTGTLTVDAADKQKRYWRFSPVTVDSYWIVTAMNCDALDAFLNVDLVAAPAMGAVITAEYDTDVAFKDADHVLDVTVTVTLAEYTP